MKSKEIIEKLDRLIPNPKCPLEYSKDYELLMAVMLSAQSTDDRVNSVTKELFKFDLNDLADLDPSMTETISKNFQELVTKRAMSSYQNFTESHL